MPSVGSITKTIRINAEDKEYLEKMMDERGLTWSGVVHQIVSERGTPTKKESIPKGTPLENRQDLMDKAVERDIGSMCKLSGISTHDFYRGICELWNKGYVCIEDGKVKSKGEWKMDKFEEMCHIMHENPQSVIDKIAKGLR